MSGPKRSVGAICGLAVLAVLATGLAMSAAAQTPPVVEVRAPIGPRPDFYVPWNPTAPGLTARPMLKRVAPPKYPPASVRAKEAGQTTLEFCITVEGQLTDIRLLTSSGFPRLDQAVLDWAPSASYSPARFNNAPFAVCGFRLTYEWRIDTDSGQRP